jgi:diaminopimelate epimerase
MKFLKMEGLGNDFIMMHGLTDIELAATIQKASYLCDRRKGIGADGIIFVLPSQTDTADFRMRIINSDGSEAEMCGNGIRCYAKYLNEMNLSDKSSLTIETLAGIIKTERVGDKITVDMGKPILDAMKIPTTKTDGKAIMVPVVVEEKEFLITAVSMGNPHGIVYADELADDIVLRYGPLLESHTFFPKKANIEFARVLSDNKIEMRVYERGCGETMACGTGACAAVVSGIINKKHGNRVTVHLLGGDLLIEWDGNTDHSVFMTGPANIVYRGDF